MANEPATIQPMRPFAPEPGLSGEETAVGQGSERAVGLGGGHGVWSSRSSTFMTSACGHGPLRNKDGLLTIPATTGPAYAARWVPDEPPTRRHRHVRRGPDPRRHRTLGGVLQRLAVPAVRAVPHRRRHHHRRAGARQLRSRVRLHVHRRRRHAHRHTRGRRWCGHGRRLPPTRSCCSTYAARRRCATGHVGVLGRVRARRGRPAATDDVPPPTGPSAGCCTNTYADVTVESDSIYVQDGNVWTSAG